MTGKEMAYYRENVKRIEALMDHPVPTELLSIKDLSKPMTGAEISNYRENIRRIEETQLKKTHQSNGSNEKLGLSKTGSEYLMILVGAYILVGCVTTHDYFLLPLGLFLLLPIWLKVFKKKK